MNVLCIGNSFSEDATTYLQKIANGELYVRNLAIGGCSLERHYNNIVNNVSDYGYEVDGESIKISSIEETVKERKWDVISLQQVSHYSGIIDTYEPFLGEIVKYLKEKCPSARLVLHRTWAYDDKSDHEGFVSYDRDRKKMYNAIVDTTNKIAEKYSLDIIPCGDAIELVRDLPEFSNGAELNINRDGFHLSFDYGRYLAGLVMYRFFTGKSATEVGFEPKNTDKEINRKLKEIANKVFLN
ncbi:MAG: DUF4886 domain-containing protein [Ruminococcaceae bacterium]|nr:DUF4886 domain-containing protein [Oscillospiraceae bacterium]